VSAEPEPAVTAEKDAEEQALPAPADREWPKQWHRIFLQSLSVLPNVTAACRTAGISKVHAYRTRDENPAFAQAWTDALEIARDAVERRAYQWIMTGVPVKKQVTKRKLKNGVVVEEETTTTESAETNATLMIFWLKAWMPDRYRWAERVETSGPDAGPIQVESIDRIDRQIAELAAELGDRAKEAVLVDGD
jgi:hypothetical protein